MWCTTFNHWWVLDLPNFSHGSYSIVDFFRPPDQQIQSIRTRFGVYPLVITNITMEIVNFPLIAWWFSIVTLVYQRGSTVNNETILASSYVGAILHDKQHYTVYSMPLAKTFQNKKWGWRIYRFEPPISRQSWCAEQKWDQMEELFNRHAIYKSLLKRNRCVNSWTQSTKMRY